MKSYIDRYKKYKTVENLREESKKIQMDKSYDFNYEQNNILYKNIRQKHRNGTVSLGNSTTNFRSEYSRMQDFANKYMLKKKLEKDKSDILNKSMDIPYKFKPLKRINFKRRSHIKHQQVDENECYSGRLLIHHLDNNSSGNLSTSRSTHAVIFTIHEDKITYVIVGSFPLSKGAKLNVYDDRDEIFHIYFNNVMFIKKGKYRLGYDLQMKDGMTIFISSYGKDKFAKVLSEKFDKFQTNSNVKTSTVVEEKDPLTKIKEAKELLDLGAITQEEFDEIKSKYLKQI